jgi:hypothetical protein
LELGAYDAILGMDLLKQNSPMVTDRGKHCLDFPYNNKFVQLNGWYHQVLQLSELPIEQLIDGKGNEVWALAIV